MIELLIQRASNAYFWVFIIGFIIHFLYSFTDEYENIKKIRIEKGNYSTDLTFTTVAGWVLFILSCYYR